MGKILNEPKYYNERIKYAILYRGETETNVAKNIGISLPQLARYLSGTNVMPVTHLKGICQFLNISPEYIIGLTDDIIPIQSKIKIDTRI